MTGPREVRRVACIALPEVRLEVAREKEAERTMREGARAMLGRGVPGAQGAGLAGLEGLASWKPEPLQVALAVVIARPGGAVKTERDVLGNTRLDVVSREARALGVRPGQTVAAARAKCGDLRVRVVPEGAVHAALARIAEAALAFGPASGFDVARDVVWVDVSGCAHLHAGPGLEAVEATPSLLATPRHVANDVSGARGSRANEEISGASGSRRGMYFGSRANEEISGGSGSRRGGDFGRDRAMARRPSEEYCSILSEADNASAKVSAESPPPPNEVALVRALEARVQSLGHACRVAVANGPRVAMAVAKFAPAVVPPGGEAAAMRVLPVAALGLDEDTTAWLRDLGLARCGDLQKLPRKSLGVRLGERVRDVMLLLDGEDHAPLAAWRPPEVPEERVELEWGAASLEALAFVLKTLCDRLAARLQGRAMGAARLELVLSLDRALCSEATHRSVFDIVLPVPLAGAVDLLAVVRSRLEHATLAAPVLMVTLRAPELARTEGRTVSLLEPEPAAGRAMPRLVAELSAELGAGRVGVLELVDTWQPEERTRLVPLGARPPVVHHPLVTSALEPTRIVPARPVDRASLQRIRPLARVDGLEWWRRPPRRRDFAAAWLAHGTSAGVASPMATSSEKEAKAKATKTKELTTREPTAKQPTTKETRGPTPRDDVGAAGRDVGTLAWVECEDWGAGAGDAILRGWMD